MPKKAIQEILVNFVIDESGSMSSCRDQVISGFNEYIQTVSKQDGKTAVSLTKFNSSATVVFTDKPIHEVPPLTAESYVPDQMTALLDAIGNSIKAVDVALLARKKKPKVLFVVMTDGFENASKEYSRSAIKDLIGARESAGGWTFVYLGANQDAFTTSQTIGFGLSNTSNYGTHNTRGVFYAAAASTQVLRSSVEAETECFAATMDSFDDDLAARNVSRSSASTVSTK